MCATNLIAIYTLVIETYFTNNSEMFTLLWQLMMSQGLLKSVAYINVCMKFNDNLSNSCLDIQYQHSGEHTNITLSTATVLRVFKTPASRYAEVH